MNLLSNQFIAKHINTELQAEYFRLRNAQIACIVGESAKVSLSYARTLLQWRKLENQGLVRLQADYEDENYFDIYGEPDTEKEKQAIIDAIETNGLYYVYSQFLSCEKCDTWETADGIGMCIYNNPTDPYENPYVLDLMSSAIAQLEQNLNLTIGDN